MIIDVSNILKESGIKRHVYGEVAFGELSFMGVTYDFPTPVKIEGDISNNGKNISLNAVMSGSFITPCARCMKNTEVKFSFDMEEVFVREEDGAEDTDEDVRVFSGHAVYIDDIAADNFFMNVSARYLCREDCKGLCPECGADLNEGDCNCVKGSIDPRWAGLLDIMNNSAEE